MEGSVAHNMDQGVTQEEITENQLNGSWTLWAHLPHDTDWSINSYKKIDDFNTVEAAVALTETLPHKMIKNCMLFLMREGIAPTWEDSRNRAGGSFSYKVTNKIVPSIWRDLTYNLVGETLGASNSVQSSINGITISPKKNFCVIKVWMANCSSQDPTIINQIGDGIVSHGCLFKKHNPEY